MREYKTINQFTLQDCEKFLKENPGSQYVAQVKSRKQQLLDRERERGEKEKKILEEKRIEELQAQERKSKKRTVRIWIGVLIITMVLLTSLVILTIRNNSQNNSLHEIEQVECETANSLSDSDNDESVDIEKFDNSGITISEVKHLISSYCDAVTAGDFDQLRKLYAYSINRYHSKNNTTVDYVIDSHIRYDERYGVYGKRFDIRWGSLDIADSDSEGKTSVSVIMDYHIDRQDETKKSDFVLRKHFVLNQDKKIIEEYDDVITSE